MTEHDRTVSELSSLFRMIQVIPDADSVGKIYQMLLAFCTTWHTIGFERAFLYLVDSRDRMVRGQLAAEEPEADAPTAAGETDSFEALAKSVFQNYEQIDSSDLTLKTKTFEVSVDSDAARRRYRSVLRHTDTRTRRAHTHSVTRTSSYGVNPMGYLLEATSHSTECPYRHTGGRATHWDVGRGGLRRP